MYTSILNIKKDKQTSKLAETLSELWEVSMAQKQHRGKPSSPAPQSHVPGGLHAAAFWLSFQETRPSHKATGKEGTDMAFLARLFVRQSEQGSGQEIVDVMQTLGKECRAWHEGTRGQRTPWLSCPCETSPGGGEGEGGSSQT